MSNSIAPGSSADVNVKVTALTTNPNVPVTYKTVILKKNLVNGVNTLTQEMMSDENIKYVIKYDYVLGEDIIIPANCVLEFDGGSLNGNNNVVLTLDKTLITGAPRFSISNYSGTILNDEVHLSWFTDGMSSDTDYSKNDHDTFIKAMKLASRKSEGWLNGDKIPVFIEGQVEITENYGNIGLTQLNIVFRPLHDDDSLLYYNSISQWRGYYSPITDSVFKCIDGINGVPLKDICCIRKYVWYDTYYTYWRDIKAQDFTGYFLLNQTYLQEVTFENISISSGCGFIGFNSDGHYAGDKGRCQIVHTLNLNHNNGRSNYADYTSYKNVFDFYNVMELTMVNTVIQGLASGTDIKAISVKCNDLNGGNNRATVKLDGFWVEYPAGNVDNAIFIEENGVYTFTNQNVSKVIITNANVHATLNLEQRILRNIILDIPDNCEYITAYANANIMGAVTDANGNDAYSLFNKGILRFNNIKGTGWRGIDDYPNIITYNKVIDALKLWIETNNDWYKYSRRKDGVCDNNGITCIKIWNDFAALYYVTSEILLPQDFHLTAFQGPLVVRIVYRATILVDVTEENINDIIFQSGYIAGTLGGTTPNIVSPKVGDTAGTTEGWKEVFRVIGIDSFHSTWTGAMAIKLRNVQVEYAEFKVGYYNMAIDPDVLVVSPTELKRTKGAAESEVYHISAITGSTLENIIGNSKSIFEYGGNLYRNVGGNVKPLVPLVNTTSNRPANPSIGEQFFDKTIGKPIWYNGTAWVDATGTTV